MTLLENIIAVEVPEGAKDFYINSAGTRNVPKLCYCHDSRIKEYPLHSGNWQFLFCTGDASEEQIQDSGLVDYREVDLGEMGIYKKWLNYENGQYELDTAKESLQSLLSSKGLKQNYALLKKII